MKLKSRIALALAAAAMPPLAPALAADYDPPIYVDEAPEYTPVEVGSGWYLRGDVAYAFNKPFKNSTFGADPADPLNQVFNDRFTPWSGSIGMGYHLNDYFRAELNFGIMPRQKTELKSDFDGPLGNDGFAAASSTANDTYSGMLNAYADLGTYAGFTPYVGAGAGLIYNKYSYNLAEAFEDPTTPSINFTDTQRNYDFAYTLGAGIAYNVSKNVAIDVGYQYFSSPDAKWAKITGPDTYEIKKGIDYHQVKVGLRYDLW